MLTPSNGGYPGKLGACFYAVVRYCTRIAFTDSEGKTFRIRARVSLAFLGSEPLLFFHVVIRIWAYRIPARLLHSMNLYYFVPGCVPANYFVFPYTPYSKQAGYITPLAFSFVLLKEILREDSPGALQVLDDEAKRLAKRKVRDARTRYIRQDVLSVLEKAGYSEIGPFDSIEELQARCAKLTDKEKAEELAKVPLPAGLPTRFRQVEMRQLAGNCSYS